MPHRRTIGRRPVKTNGAFIEPIFDGEDDPLNNGTRSALTDERRRIKQAGQAGKGHQQIARLTEHDQQRIAEDIELKERHLEPLQGDIAGPGREADKQEAIATAEHKRLTGGRF